MYPPAEQEPSARPVTCALWESPLGPGFQSPAVFTLISPLAISSQHSSALKYFHSKVKTSSVSVCPAAGLRGVAFPALPWGLARAELDNCGLD